MIVCGDTDKWGCSAVEREIFPSLQYDDDRTMFVHVIETHTDIETVDYLCIHLL